VTGHGGLDGCRGGWVLATLGPDGSLDISLVDDFAVPLAAVVDGRLAALAVDMPIGLPEDGHRAADREARRRLGARRSTIFPTPCRATLDAATYDEALAISRRSTGKGMSVQAFNLLARIREVDRLMRPELQDRVVECHPELAFARLAGAPVARSKHTAKGVAERVTLLEAALAACGGDHGAVAAAVAGPPRGARSDDVADAIAIAIVARALTDGRAEHLGDGRRDRRGLRMEIVA
jgi:predicted RNase H-like nuclease